MPVEIVDVQTSSQDGISNFDLSKQILDGLSRPNGQKTMPTMLLYDERGLRLYDDITTAAPEYYLFGAEEEILKNHADDIVRTMHSRNPHNDSSDEVVLELGAGALRKTSHILKGLSRFAEDANRPSPITYYALDLEKRELERTLGEIQASEIGQQLNGKVATKGICGTYDDGLRFIENGGLSSPFADGFTARGGSPISSGSSESDSSSYDFSSHPSSPVDAQPELHIMFLGSSLGNFPREEADGFLRSLPLRPGAGDTLLLGLDHDNDKEQIEVAYNDPKGYTKRFIMNGLRNAGRTLGDEHMFDEDKWEYVNFYDSKQRRHEAFYKSKCSHSIVVPSAKAEFRFSENEMLKIEESVKYSEVDAWRLFTNANLRPIQRWTDSRGQYSLWLLERPPFNFPLLKSPSASKTEQGLIPATPFSFPTRGDWEDMWEVWNTITLGMIPPSMLHEKPIDLRHICLFYLGHIPTFLDIHLSRLLGEPHTEPEQFKYIFERGIDPDVEDPTKCHPHSEVPKEKEDWPSLESILQFQARVRQRVRKLYDDLESGAVPMTRKIARVLFMTLEHEAMHAETLLYMLLQRAGTGTLPPPGFTAPHWEMLVQGWNNAPVPGKKTAVLGPASVNLGHDDDELEDTTAMDVEKVKQHEFGWDNENPKRTVEVKAFAIEWRPVTNGEFYSFYTGEGQGKVDLPASWIKGHGTIKVRTLYGSVDMEIAKDWPVITSYNNLSTYAIVKGGRLPTEPELRLFYDKFEAGYEGGANVGFRNWHPVPATTGLDKADGRGHNGGVWEWTSTVFDQVDGFRPSALYPGYSMDFFDGKHQVVLGGSYATVPRIANRRSFRNWYQRNYPYAWIGGRIAYDLPPN
ncbi:DUF323 domain-containing protein [Coprinopsis cinerea okayama7|uniref:DUF323 domain-containing protein n=1 Tax=Coprinopsis cinerea (strain Okayama-7 / 130 / ATCC MYA-4618 / FGSC 9003) TaxID=240176 RepID=A8NRV0_COPC7|nr:DUF323 domain-containing protein [Coprinopsis cinerea okayama7\|eukprot:XP_001835861.1 DUF323 domain-containing protein [Coprinopsis cinerea okayama7\